ncbi:LVIVD repeat-containing protein [Agromyces bauzanensis]
MRDRGQLRTWPAAAATIAALGAVVLTPPAAAQPADREPSIGPGLEWVAHRDNPFRQGDDPDFINSDLAFTGDHLVQGNYAGFSIWDIADPTAPELTSAVSCPGGQGDISAVGNLVIVSIDETMSDDSCEAWRVPETEENWEGIRIFDISDPRRPRYAAAVRTRCGSHTHTIVPDPGGAERVFVYVNAYSRGASLNCTGRNPLQVVEVPLDTPEDAAVVTELDLFDDATAFGPDDRIAGGAETRSTTGCHDITAYPAKGLAVAACRGDGLLLSIADPLAPVVLQRVRDPAVAFWHSGIFDNDATRIVFQDELGDGFINTCSPAFGADRGADAVWLIQPDGLAKAGTYKLPRAQSDLEKCVAHSGGLVPVPGRFIVAQAWLEGGVSVIDFTDPAAPVELTWFDRPDYGYSMDYTAGIWSVYPYRGYLYASDMYEGLEVLRLTDPLFADSTRYDDSGLNPQTQPEYAWVWREAPVVPTAEAERASLETLVVEPTTMEPAATATVAVSLPPGSLEPGETVDVWWMPTQAVLATVTAAADGSLAATDVTIPGPLEAGRYDLVVRGDLSAPRLAIGTVDVADPGARSDPEPAGGGLPWWPFLAALAVLLLVGAGAFAVLARRRRAS